jgi:sulfatase maturation enzyme AslB (radical SAM superfamily)
MSGEVERIKQVRDELNAISPSFCLAKWKQVTVHLQNGQTHSCHHPGTHHVPLTEIARNPSALHNTQYKKEQRKLMLEGKRPKECQYCWNAEDMPGDHISDRAIKSSEFWALDSMQEVASLPWDADVKPTYLEVSFSNVCNFKCAYCGPVHSSRWVEEIETHGPYPTSGKFNNLDYYKSEKKMPIHHKEFNPYVEAFWKWLPEIYSGLRILRITGGEPLLDDNVYKLMDYIDENPRPDLEFSLNTNGCVPDKVYDKFLSKLKKLVDEKKIGKVQLFASIDTAEAQAEWIRTGLNYEQWLRNIDRILREISTVKMVVMCTGNLLSITNFKRLLIDIAHLKYKHYIRHVRHHPIVLDVAILRWPLHLSANILPSEYAAYMDSAIDYIHRFEESKNNNPPYLGFFDLEIAKLERFVEYIRKGPTIPKDQLDAAHRDFYMHVTTHDKRRGTNFLSTFPELAPFYKMCEQKWRDRFSV